MLVVATPIAGPTRLFVATPAESLTKHLLYAVIGGLIVVTGVFAVPTSPYAAVMGTRRCGTWATSPTARSACTCRCSTSSSSWGDYRLFGGQSLEIWFVTVAISLVVSEVAYRLIERPSQRLRGVPLRLPFRGSQPSASAQADTTRS